MIYTTKRQPNRKTAKLAVLPDNSVTITVPKAMSDEEVEEIIQKKRLWILKKKALNNEVRRPAKGKEFVSGEAFSYLGRNYRLKIEQGDVLSTKCKAGYLVTTVSLEAKEEDVRQSILAWYESNALKKFKQRVKRYADLLNVEPKEVRLGSFTKQWGSCHRDGKVLFNWRVIMAPMSIVDYVVAHELCHLIHHDHSQEFWRLLARVMPDYQERKDWLRINGAYLEI